MLLALIALLAAAPVTATSPAPATDPLAKGTMGFQFNFPVGGSVPVGTGSTVGVTYLLNDNMSAHLDFGLDATLSSGAGPASFNIGLGLRLYQLRRGPVAVFFWPQLTIGRHVVGTVGATGVENIVIAGGAGAEYFFADHFSVGGQLGIGLNFDNIGGPTGSSVVTSISTATSGLFASVYF